VPDFDEAHRIDERASEVYEHLTGGRSTADAGVIADNLASMVKRSETDGARLSAQIASIDEPK
jgi:hypothetical protein